MTANTANSLPAPPPLASIQRPALFLDLDGTLAAIEPQPEDVKAEPWRTQLLDKLHDNLEGRLAVVSGRTLEELDRILEGAVPALAAVHGLIRRRQDGTVLQSPPHPGLTAARAEVAALTAGRTGLKVEDKGLSIALHYRQAPVLGARIRADLQRIAKENGLKLQMGDMVAEICSPGFDKGAAVRAFMAEEPFAGSTPIFVGDDLTDEDGFRIVREMGGLGVLAGAPRPTFARSALPGVEAVRAWLETSQMEPAAS